MKNKNVLVIDQDMDMKLGAVCNSALKNAGIERLLDVNFIIDSIEEEHIVDDPDLFSKYDD